MLLATVVCGCAGEEEALIVLYSPAFQQGECSAVAGSSTFLQKGLLDVGYGTGYTLPIVLFNNLSSRPGNTSSSGVENGELQLQGVDVTLSMPQAPDVIRQLAAEDSALIEFATPLPSVSLAPSQETGVLVDVVTQSASIALRQAILDNLDETARPTLVAEVVFHATRTGNSTGSVGVLDSRAYQFPIDLCIGCLRVTCETCPDGQCPADPQFTGICGNAQDSTLVPNLCDPLGQ